jgi:hypothetical protein
LLSVVVVVVALVELTRQLVEALVVAVVAVEGKIGAFFVPLMFLRRSLCQLVHLALVAYPASHLAVEVLQGKGLGAASLHLALCFMAAAVVVVLQAFRLRAAAAVVVQPTKTRKVVLEQTQRVGLGLVLVLLADLLQAEVHLFWVETSNREQVALVARLLVVLLLFRAEIQPKARQVEVAVAASLLQARLWLAGLVVTLVLAVWPKLAHQAR